MSGESDKNYESGRRHIKSGGLGSLSFTPNFNGQSENSQIKLFCKIPIIQGLKKDFKFQLVLWASISHISLAQGHFLLVSVYDSSRGWFACTLEQVY